MKHWKIAIGLVALAAISGFAGLRVGQALARRSHGQGAAEAWPETALRSLDRKLKLTPAQHDRVQAALDRAIDKLKGIRQQALAETSVVVKELVAEVDADLTPEQRQAFAMQKPGAAQITLDLLRVEPRKK
jgi:hypothetical protein